ncbi:hypothetical protein PRNP1_010568 [Phytophthora ramorum]
MADSDQDSLRNAELTNESETPHFDALFAQYDTGNGIFGTEHLGSLLLDMGFNASPKVLDRALDDMDPNATGEIAKLSFLEWFEENADDIDDTPPGRPAQASMPISPHSQQQDEADSELEKRSQEIRDKQKRAIRQRQAAQKSYEKGLVKRTRENLAREHEKRLVSEKKIHRMEAEEAELIAKLRVTQELQRVAYEELEFAMQDE